MMVMMVMMMMLQMLQIQVPDGREEFSALSHSYFILEHSKTGGNFCFWPGQNNSCGQMMNISGFGNQFLVQPFILLWSWETAVSREALCGKRGLIGTEGIVCCSLKQLLPD